MVAVGAPCIYASPVFTLEYPGVPNLFFCHTRVRTQVPDLVVLAILG